MVAYNTTGRRRTRVLSIASQRGDQKPVLDEKTFQQLLAAAYVIQEHHIRLADKAATPNADAMFSEIAEIQSLVRAGLDVTPAAELITDRLRKFTSAAGVSLSLVSDGYLDCVAESGVPARIPGSSVASHSLVATEKLRNGELFESAEACADTRLSLDLCRLVGVGSLLAAPIHEFGQIAGVLEVRWTRAHTFQENHVRACRVMADLATGILERKARMAEREAAKPPHPSDAPPPNNATTGSTGSPAGSDSLRQPEDKPVRPVAEEPAPTDGRVSGVSESAPERCRVCGRPFGPGEVFCGNCSLPRSASKPSERLQSKWASLWYIQQAERNWKAKTAAAQSQAAADGAGLDLGPAHPAAQDGAPKPAAYPAAQETRNTKPAPYPAAQETRNTKPAPYPAAQEIHTTKPTAYPSAQEIHTTKPTAYPSAQETRNTKPAPYPAAQESRYTKPAPYPAAQETRNTKPTAYQAAQETRNIKSAAYPAAQETRNTKPAPYPAAQQIHTTKPAPYPAAQETRNTKPVAYPAARETQTAKPTALTHTPPRPVTTPVASRERDFSRPVSSLPSVSDGKTRTDFRENREQRVLADARAAKEAHDHTRALETARARSQRRKVVGIAVVILLVSFMVLWAGTAPQDSAVSWYQPLLVELGFGQPAHHPLMGGNPDTRVWLDVQRRVYYCPGSQLYGKTPGGQFQRQRGAQQDYFLPAYGFVCP